MTSSTLAASSNGAGCIQPVAYWVDGDKEISVFQERDKLKYSITRGSDIETSDIETGDISLKLYGTEDYRKIALHFIKIFRHALFGSKSGEHCFLPIFWSLYKQPDSAQEWTIGLFARLKYAGNGGKEVVEAQWGVSEDDTVTWLEAGDSHTHAFLVGAPAYHDKMLIYREHFEEVVALDSDRRIQSIVLKCVSVFDRSVFLDENTCAITLISAQKRGGIAGFLKLGHGSVAWEGMEAGSYFLRWADITSEYPDKQPGQGGARIRFVNREMPSERWLVGPTFPRTKELTNRMVEYLSRDVVVRDGTNWSSVLRFGFFAPLRNLFKTAYEMEKERRMFTSLENCLSFAVSALQRASVFLPEPGRAIPEIEPNAYVMRLLTDYVTEDKGVEGQIIYENKKGDAPGEIADLITARFLADIEDIIGPRSAPAGSSQD